MRELRELRELGTREENIEEWLLDFIESAPPDLSPENQLNRIKGMLYRRPGRN
jgi:hypothetical protein